MESGLLIAASTFVLVMLVGFLLFFYLTYFKKKLFIGERIRKEAAAGREEGAAEEGIGKKVVLRTVRRIGEAVQPKLDTNASKTRLRLLRAGYSGEYDPMTFFGTKAMLAVFLLLCFAVSMIAALPALPARKFLALLALAAMIGFYLPDYFLYWRTRDKKKKIFEGFPDALDLLVVCVEAGMGLDAAIKRVGDEIALKNKILSDEFKVLSLELRAGKSRAEALRNLALRTDVEDVSSLVTLLIQTDRFGTRVAQALRIHSEAMRTKRYQRAEEVASKLPVKILFPLVLFILPGLVATLMGPAIIKFYRIILKGTLAW